MLKKDFYYLLLGILIFGLSLALRLNHIADSGFNLDEMVSLRLAENLSLDNLFIDNHPPILQFVLKIFTSIFGLNEFTARVPSALASAFTTGLIGVILVSGYGARVSLLAMLLHAVMPMSIRMAQLARPYALFELFALIQLYYFSKFIQNNFCRRKLILASILAISISYLAFLLFVFEIIYYQVKKKNVMWVVWGSFVLIILIFFSRELVEWRALNWQLIRYKMESFGFLPIEPLFGYSFSSYISAFGIIILLAIWISKLDRAKIEKATPLAVAIVVILMTLGSFALAYNRSIFLERYYAFFAPIILILMSVEIDLALKEKNTKAYYAGFVSIFLILVGAGISLYRLYPIRHSPWREASIEMSIYPSSVVLTSVGSSIKFPYFDRLSIPVFQFEDFSQPTNRVVSELNKYENVWIIDSFWGFIQYKDELIRHSKELNLKVSEYSRIEDGIDNIVVIRINK